MADTILESERLFIKPLSINELKRIKNNRDITLNAPIIPESLSDIVLSAITKKIEKMRNVEERLHRWYTYWLIIDKKTGNGIGFVGFKGIDRNGYSEVGYSIAPDYRKRGLMTEALNTFIKWAYDNQNLRGITAAVHNTNIGSIRVLKNCNFELTGFSDNEEFYCIKFK